MLFQPGYVTSMLTREQVEEVLKRMAKLLMNKMRMIHCINSVAANFEIYIYFPSSFRSYL